MFQYRIPVNQEDMVGTLLTFSAVILDGLKKMGFSISTSDADAYLHAWNVVGHLSGVEIERYADEGVLDTRAMRNVPGGVIQAKDGYVVSDGADGRGGGVVAGLRTVAVASSVIRKTRISRRSWRSSTRSSSPSGRGA